MKQRTYKILVLIIVSGWTFSAFSQIPNVDSLQKTILESVRKGLDKETFSHSYLDTSKIQKGNSPVDLDRLFKEIDKEVSMAKSRGEFDKVEGGYHDLSKLDSMRGNYKGAYENYKLYSLYRDSLQNGLAVAEQDSNCEPGSGYHAQFQYFNRRKNQRDREKFKRDRDQRSNSHLPGRHA